MKTFNDVYLLPNMINECIVINESKDILFIEKNNFNANNIPEDFKTNNEKHDKLIYIGAYQYHYGHFLIETLSRFWIFIQEIGIKNINDYKFIISISRMPAHVFLRIMNKNILFNYILKCFNINKNNLVYLYEKPLYVNELLIPDKYILLNQKNKYNTILKSVYDTITDYTLKNNLYNINNIFNDKIFIYRGNNGERRINYEIEENITNIFKKYNFKIIIPTIRNFKDNIIEYKKCKVIAGFEGTNLHNILFCNKNILLISIASNRYDNFDANQENCNKIANTNSIFIQRKYYNNLKCFEDKLKNILLTYNLI